jgi:hypothetical protein
MQTKNILEAPSKNNEMNQICYKKSSNHRIIARRKVY